MLSAPETYLQSTIRGIHDSYGYDTNTLVHTPPSTGMMGYRGLHCKHVPHVEHAHCCAQQSYQACWHHLSCRLEALVHDACEQQSNCQRHCSCWPAQLPLHTQQNRLKRLCKFVGLCACTASRPSDAQAFQDSQQSVASFLPAVGLPTALKAKAATSVAHNVSAC